MGIEKTKNKGETLVIIKTHNCCRRLDLIKFEGIIHVVVNQEQTKK